MTASELRGFAEGRVLIFEGAFGTMLQAAVPGDIPPELMTLEHPDQITAVHKAYTELSDVICTNTFGANDIKLDAIGMPGRARELNERAASLARDAASPGTLVAGDVGPTGRMVEPLGELPFEDAYDAYREQAEALAEGGVDFMLIETMSDLREAKAALLAARDATGLPVMITMTFGEDFVTPTGTDPATAANVLASMGAFAVGANCSTGPSRMVEVIGRMAQTVSVPILAQPNAGIPELVDGRTVFKVGPDEFAAGLRKLVTAGATMVGGCCGTTPEHMLAVRRALEGVRPVSRDVPGALRLSSRTRTVAIGSGFPFAVVGERINPTNREALTNEILDGRTEIVLRDARAQEEAGAAVLDVNVGVPGADERSAMRRAARALENAVDAPLSLDSMNAEAFEATVCELAGKPLLNSVTAHPDRLDAVLPVAARWGAGVVCLALDEGGIRATAGERVEILRRIVAAAESHGVPREHLIADCLTLAVSAEQERVPETLRAVELVRSELGIPTILGVSNVSHGLPDRSVLNASFLAMAMERGLDAAIMNPLDETMMATARASSVLTLRDRGSAEFIREHAKRRKKKGKGPEVPPSDESIESRIRQCVLDGNVEGVSFLIDEALSRGREPKPLNDDVLVPALEEVGLRFERGECFLPQMMLAAETVERAFGILKPYFPRDEGRTDKGTVVLATVEGDVHDIGKNIVASVLENNGYRVVDLGKNVPTAVIVQTARDESADVVGLSALMTTTVVRIPEVMQALKEAGLDCKVVVGGAVVTERFVASIGADGYAKDAAAAVPMLRELLE